MMSTWFNFKRTKANHIVLVINYPFNSKIIADGVRKIGMFIWMILYDLSTLFYQFHAKLWLVISGFGITLGLIIGLVIFSQPNSVNAFPQIVVNAQSKNQVSELKLSLSNPGWLVSPIDDIEVFFRFPSQKIVQPTWSSNLGDGGLVIVIVGGRSQLAQEVEEINIGQEIVLIGQNNGRYHYQVKQISSMSRAQISDLKYLQADQLIVLIPENVLSLEFISLLASR